MSDNTLRELSEQEQIRRNSLEELHRLGINPYPANLFEVSHLSAEIKEKFSEESDFGTVTLAGRIMSRRKS